MPDQASGEPKPIETPPAGGVTPPPETDPHAGLRGQAEDDYIKIIEKTRREAETHRKKLNALEAQIQTDKDAALAADAERKKAELSEIDRLKLEIETAKTASELLKKSVEQSRIDSGIIASIAEKGLKPNRIEEVVHWIDRSELKIESTGTVSGIDDALAKLIVERPHLFGVTAPVQAAGGSGAPGGGPPLTGANKPASTADLIALSIKDPKAAKEALKARGVYFP